MLRERIKRIHFVGIGGIGMSGLAQVLLEMGYRITGSDIREGENVRNLRKKGIEVFIGHAEENVPEDVQVVVYSSAIKEDNPEIRRAKELGIPVVSRGEMLAELFKLKEGIAVCGSHGKTTTTSMIAHILEEAGYDPTVIIGGILKRLGSNAKLGKGDLLVSEADESDGSFLKLSPAIAVITNIDREHLDYYRSLEDIRDAFSRFADSVPFYGFCVANGDDPLVKEALKGFSKKLTLYSMKGEAHVRGNFLGIEDGRYVFEIEYLGRNLGKVRLSIPGRHNLYNALASASVAFELGIPFEIVKRSLEEFRNANRRMELKGYIGDVPVYDDYGHHPTEIRAVLSTLRELFPDRRIVLAFQPHRFSRTYHLFGDFVKVLREPDVTLLTDIYPAGEENLHKVSARKLAQEAGAVFCPKKEDLFEALTDKLKAGDVLIFMGAGSIGRWCEEFLQLTKTTSSSPM